MCVYVCMYVRHVKRLCEYFTCEQGECIKAVLLSQFLANDANEKNDALRLVAVPLFMLTKTPYVYIS